MSATFLHRAKSVFSKFLSFACILFIGACDDSDATIDCGCQAGKYTSLHAEPGVIVNTVSGYQALTPAYGYIILCDQVDSSILIDGLNVRISGGLSRMCGSTGPEAPYLVYHLQSPVIVPSADSVFSAPPIEIQIIQSEHYGYSRGYGYRMTKTSADGIMKIFQPTIPAVGGNQTFDDSRDAFKVAVFVAFRTTQSDLPSVNAFDMQYLLAYP